MIKSIVVLLCLLGIVFADACATIDASVSCGAATCDLKYSACEEECFLISTCSGSAGVYGKFDTITDSQASGYVYPNSSCSGTGVDPITFRCNDCNTFGIFFLYLECDDGSGFNYWWLLAIAAVLVVIIVIVLIVGFILFKKFSQKNQSILYSQS